MEKSKHYKEILALGQLLVEELDLEQSRDTLGRWIAHHIVELLAEADKSEGDEKKAAEDRCRDAILAIWKHIRAFPSEHRPLKNIEPLLATIRALNPDNRAYFYTSEAENKIDQSTLSEQAKEYLELSLGVDYSARLIIDTCLKYAANEVTEEKQELFDLAESLDIDTLETFAVRFITDVGEKSDTEQEAELIRETIKNLQNRRERITEMVALSKHLITSIDEEIHDMEQLLRD